MNSRIFLRFRMLIELVTGFVFVIVAVDVDQIRISSYIWLDIPCRLLLAILAFGIFSDALRVHRDAGAAKSSR